MAYLVGYDVIVRTGLVLGGYQHYLAGWHATSTVGPIGAAAACAKLIGLAPERFAAALSLAMSTSAGLKAQFGTDAKPLHAGFAARTGVEVALLAATGLTANPAVTDGVYGFLARYGAGAHAARTPCLNADPTCKMETDPVLRKPWPSCSYTHRSVEAALALARAEGFDTSRIAQGTVRLPEPYYRVAPFLAPNTPAQARFSVLYCVASALYDGTLTPDSFAESAIDRPAVHALMARFTVDAYDVGPSLDDMSPSFPDTVSLRLMDGTEHFETVANVKGGVNNPLCESDIFAKFALCGGPTDLAESLLSGETCRLFRFS
ncbi:MAG: MmgE/PrpD family protein [Gammaproteobacteria bacterium]|nr:MmgE/PrpD family protein [Gammaproteobacteria bacterium]